MGCHWTYKSVYGNFIIVIEMALPGRRIAYFIRCTGYNICIDVNWLVNEIPRATAGRARVAWALLTIVVNQECMGAIQFDNNLMQGGMGNGIRALHHHKSRCQSGNG
jgi:hypothetical protein